MKTTLQLLQTFSVTLFLVLAGNRGSVLYGQSLRDTLFESIKSQMEPLITLQKEPSPFDFSQYYNLNMVDAVLNLKDMHLEPINKDLIFDLKMAEVKRDLGLNLRSQFYHQFDNLAQPAEETDDPTSPTRMRLGVEWALLRDGFFAHQNKVKQLQNEKEIEWLKFDQRRNHERLFFRRNVLAYHFNKEKIKVLEKRRENLATELDMLYRIYFLRDIMFEQIIARKSQLDQVDVQLKSLRDFNALVETTLQMDELPVGIEVAKLPLLELDVERLLKDSSFLEPSDRIRKLEEQNRRIKNDAVNDIDFRLQFFENFNVAKADETSRLYPSLGASLTVPFEVFSNNKLLEQQVTAENNELERLQQYARLNTTTEIVNLYYEYAYKAKQHVEFLYKYLLYEERLRVQNVHRVQFHDYYQPFDILRDFDELRQIQLELLDLKLQMYLLLVNIYAKTNLKSLKPYLQPISFQQYVTRLPANRMIYVSGEDLRRFDRQFIDKYLQFNDFEYAIVEDADWMDARQYHAQDTAVSASGIRLIKTLPWNTAELEPEKAGVVAAVNLQREGFGGVMLYVEANFPASLLQKQLDRMVKHSEAMRSVAPGLKVFISLPPGFPLNALSGAHKRFDKVILRASQWADMVQFRNQVTKTPPFERFPVCFTLDVHHIKDRLKLEAYIGQVMAELEVEDLLLDDFSAYVQMETNTMK
jgi:hypothetical protein